MVLDNKSVNNKRIVRNTSFLYFRMFLIMSVTLYLSRLLLKILGVEDFGIYNVVGGIVSMFAFMNGALSGATSRFLTIEIGKKDILQLQKVFSTSIVAHVGLGVIVFILAETIGVWFLFNKMEIPTERLYAANWVLQFSIFTSVLNLLQIPYTAMIIAYENMKVFAIISIIDVIFKLLLVLLLSYIDFDKLIIYSGMMFIVQISIASILMIYCKTKYTASKFIFQRDKKLYMNIFSFSGWDLLGNISVLAQGQGLNLLLNIFFGPIVNAARGIAFQVQGAISQFSNNFIIAVKPQIIKYYAEGNKKEMMELMQISSVFSYYLILLLTVPVYYRVDYILTLWLDEYPKYTEIFLKIILVANLIQVVKKPRVAIFHAMAKIRLTNIIVGLTLISAFPISYIFLKLGYGPESVFYVSIFTLILSEYESVIILKRYINYSVKNYLYRVHLKCAFISIVVFLFAGFLTNYIESSFWGLLLFTIIVSVLTSLLFYFIGIDKLTRETLNKFLKNKINGYRK